MSNQRQGEINVSKKAYKRVVEYYFEVDGKMFAITDVGKNYVRVENVRKNGPEATHMLVVLLVTMEGKFVRGGGESRFVDHRSESLADAICKYVNTHGFPCRGNTK